VKGNDAPSFQGTDRFSIVRSIGAGGMGVVYEAHDRERDAKVALKTLRTMDAQALYRFKHEFRSLAEVVHPNLVSLYELFSDGDSWFFTMELIDGGVPFLSYLRGNIKKIGQRAIPCDTPSNDDRSDTRSGVILDAPAENKASDADEMTVDLKGTAESGVTGSPVSELDSNDRPQAAGIDFQRLRLVFRQLAEGVSALHRSGKLHRDLKPHNVLVRPHGQVVILDFGLIAELGNVEPAPQREKSETSGPRLLRESYYTIDDHIVGTAAYMAPEQAAARPVTAASDWYAVGVMLFQAITGRLPIAGKPLDILRNKQKLDAPAPAELITDVPEDLNQLCVDLLRRTPADRPRATRFWQCSAPRPCNRSKGLFQR